MTEQADARNTHPRRRARVDVGRPKVRMGAVIAIALVIGFGVWLAVRGGSSSSTSPIPKRATAVPVSVKGLETLAGAIGQPIYWIGTKPGYTYELTKTSGNQVFIRYLPPGVRAGADKPYLTVGTYPVTNAFGVTSRLARKKGTVKVVVGGGGVAFYSSKAPTNVYLALPGSNYQVEVYDPSAIAAQTVVSSGLVKAVSPAKRGATAPSGRPTAASPSQLKALAASLQHPIYWAGSEAGVIYELSRASGDRVYIRYLPHGVAVGSRQAYLTIGTYPVVNAYSDTKALLKKKGEVQIKIDGGGIALYSTSRPNNVYLAFPGLDLQVEVYDPSATQAHAVVAAGRVVPVG